MAGHDRGSAAPIAAGAPVLIDEKMQMQEAKHLNVSVSKEEVDQALARIEQQNNMPKGASILSWKNRAFPAPHWSVSSPPHRLGQAGAKSALAGRERHRSGCRDALARVKENAGTPQSQVSQIFLAIDNPRPGWR